MIFCAFDAEVGAEPLQSSPALVILLALLAIAGFVLTVWLAHRDGQKQSEQPAEAQEPQPAAQPEPQTEAQEPQTDDEQ